MQTTHNISYVEASSSTIESIESIESMYIKEDIQEYKPLYNQSRAYSLFEAVNDRKPDEQFTYVVGHQELLISSLGRLVYNEDLIKRPSISMNNGYYQTSIDGVKIYTYRIVAEAFLGSCPDDCEVDHIDRCRHNNQLSNLRYITHSQNSLNKTSYKGHTAQYFIKLSDKCIPFKTYGRHSFDDYYIDTESYELYKWTGDKYMKRTVSYISNQPVYTPTTTLGKNTAIMISRLKKGLYNKPEQDFDQSSSLLFKSQ
ncbi:Conserved_hypothetical protein [Hexamita inflata]|uniref:HNH nuclease domain-containing protein n=1 Tax=Hexamita inflata TaxID=28002 RepID=A0AA86P5Y5_9EUKA|nr:Conserved hypothetical protein [Hexamita inflata]